MACTWLTRMLEDVHTRGYATRDPLYAGPDANYDTHLSAIVVPVRSGDAIVACLSCVWQVGTPQESAVISKGVGLLTDAANHISGLLTTPR